MALPLTCFWRFCKLRPGSRAEPPNSLPLQCSFNRAPGRCRRAKAAVASSWTEIRMNRARTSIARGVATMLALSGALAAAEAHPQSGLMLRLSARAPLVRPVQDEREPTSLCRDGRFSVGRPVDCEAELRHWREGRAPYDPCTDGRFSSGEAYDCHAEYQPWRWRERAKDNGFWK